MWIILVFLSFSAMALEPFERLTNVRILRALPNNVLLLDRGIEDGISRNNHIKITNELEGFASRAICIRATASNSYWKIYRVPNVEAFSKDYTYTIVGYADREIPMPFAKIRDEKQEIPEPEKKRDPGPDPFLVQRDLPEALTERDLIEASGPRQQKLFVEEVFDKDQLKRDLADYRFSVYASPFTRQSINEGESLRYGFRGGNIASKYRLTTQFEQQQTKMRDPLTRESVSTRSTTGQAQFVINQLTSKVSSLSLINYQATRFSLLATPKSHWQVGPVGFTWHIYESKTWEYMDLSYIPLYDIRKTEIIEANATIGTFRSDGLRHGIRFAVRSKINERVAFENLLWARPFQNLSNWEVDTQDLNLVNDLKLIFNLTNKLFFDYNLVYQKDRLWKVLNNLPETNIINSLNFRYDFDL
jgi:hypothetical protein